MEGKKLTKTTRKCSVNVELCINRISSFKKEQLIEEIKTLLKKEKTITIDTNYDVPLTLKDAVKYCKICEALPSTDQECFDIEDVEFVVYAYQLDHNGPSQEELTGGDDIPATNEWVLPSQDFHTIWDTLIFDTDVKEQLMNFARTTLLFSDQGVDSNLVTWNRVILLHGPPGTGKTSLCKALAQKLAIRLNDRYDFGQLVEINSHSLFSKWFSESGKLVQKLFDMIDCLLENPKALVFVLIDEVESLTRTRAATSSGADPSDALRVVNALLTQLDRIKRHPNVLVLTTSNITGAIDLAFVDRADIKQYIGYPSQAAIYQIYISGVLELMAKGVIVPREQILTSRQLSLVNMTENKATRLSILLWTIAADSKGFSGRTLRKIPFLAQACFLREPRSSFEDFLQAMRKAVHKQTEDALLL